MNLQETIDEIAAHGKVCQNQGDQAHAKGLNEVALKCYHRAQVAREGYLLQSNAEVSDPEYCYSIQELIKSADHYGLVRWALTDPPTGEPL
jgi:hypothetical protein